MQSLIKKRNILQLKQFNILMKLFNSSKCVILGIESSCDDTGCAIIDSNGNILGESLHSQQLIHLHNGGIIPPIAQDLHRKNIEKVVKDALQAGKVDFNKIDAIAVTVKPGLPLSLKVGMMYGKYLCKLHHKPLIPIHHMEAHALTARMLNEKLQFPFLVLLISGGHCLIALCNDVNKFLLLGESTDDAPGEVFDKVARRLKLKDVAEFSKISGGQAIELAASRANDLFQFHYGEPLLHYKNCNFSFSGIKTQSIYHIQRQEKTFNLPPDATVPDLYNLCASFQSIMTRHICHRVQRAIEFVDLKNLIPSDKKYLVVSGGVACNNFIAKGLQVIGKELGYELVRPPPKLCTDNGVMIAWNGVEKWKKNLDIMTNLESVNCEKSSPLGISLIEEVERCQISPKWIKLFNDKKAVNNSN